MRLSLKTKFTLATSVLVLAVVTVVSALYVGRLTRQVLREGEDRARFVAQQAFLASQNAFADAAEHGASPVSDSTADIRLYVQNTLDSSSTLNSLIESAVGYSPTIYDITVSDKEDIVLVSSDASLRGQKLAKRPSVTVLDRAGFLQQLRILYGPPQTFEFSLPFNLGANPYGNIRIGLSSTLIRDEISPGLVSAGTWAIGAVLLSTLLAFLVSQISLAPLTKIMAQLDRISAGQFDPEPAVRGGDELGAVSTKISGIGKQLRDVREVFSTLRENLNQVMSGVEDGLILFNVTGRAVLVSPSVEKFLSVPAELLRGKMVNEIFPINHPIRSAAIFRGDEIEPIEGAEVILHGPAGAQRIGVNVQIVREHGTRMGTLITLRDLESIERIGNQLQVSERLAAIGRVTAGVAHEVKNPLNSMRLWLEVLKGNMPVDPEPQQAVRMLDSEIDRLDRAVKTFLNFTRPVEVKFEPTDPRALLEEVADAARPSLTKAGLRLTVKCEDDMPPVMVDRQLIHQALLNLVLNACDFTPANGQVTIGALRDGEFAAITVADTGKGIAPANRNKIFQLFFTTRPGGSGIGLANTFRFVQLHNGRIEFESELGRGTTFRIELPLAEPTAEPAGKPRDYSQPLTQEKI